MATFAKWNHKQWELWLYPFLLCWTENKCVLTMCEYVSWLIPTMFSFPYLAALAAIYPHFRLVKPWKWNALNCSWKTLRQTTHAELMLTMRQTTPVCSMVTTIVLWARAASPRNSGAASGRPCRTTCIDQQRWCFFCWIWPAKKMYFLGDLTTVSDMLRMWIWSATVGNVWEFISKMWFFEPVSALMLKDLYPLNWRGTHSKTKL